MKKLMAAMLICALCLTAACGKKTTAPQTSSSDLPALTQMPGSAESARFGMDFAALLADCRDNCQPGTAGASLRAAALCAKLADLFTEWGPGPDAVTAGVEGFAETLGNEEAERFPEQLDEISSIFPELISEHGAELLDSCGYTPSHTWDAAALTPLFDALTTAVGSCAGTQSQALFETYGEPVRLWGPDGMAYFQIKLFADHALREWGNDTQHTEHDGLSWSISGDVLTIRGDWNEQFTLDLNAETATSLTDGRVYRLCGVE